MIVVVDSGGANFFSIISSIRQLGFDATLTHDAATIKNASHVILPGVGSATTGMQRLNKYHLIDVIRELQQPVLGICLGMQLLFDYSEEGNVECLKLIPGRITKLKAQESVVVPHMGWNQLMIHDSTSLLKGIDQAAYCYFTHSYIAPVNEFTIASAKYGKTFAAAVQHRNFFGTQFHPERSSWIGKTILKNFLEASI